MTEFDPEKFEDKYVHYFPELQRAYRNAFEKMNGRYDSQLIHAIDQQVLNESEPFYDESAEQDTAADPSEQGETPRASKSERQSRERGEFRIELPPNPVERVTDVAVDDEKLAATLDRYVEELETELRRVFDLDAEGEPKA